MNLIKQAESLYHRLAIERARAMNAKNHDRYLRVVLLQDSVLDRIDRRKTKCGLCSQTFEPSQLTPNKYQGQLCEKCYLTYECW